MGRRIIQATIAKLTPPKRGNRIEWDGEIPGLGLRITAGGARSFVLDYRIHGRKRRFTIGRYPEWTATAARDRALELRRGIREGIDPLEAREQDRAEPTMNELATAYMDYALVHKRPGSVRNDKGILANIVLPRLGSLRLTAITRQDIERLHAELRPTKYHANRLLALLSKMFNLAIERKWVAANPVKGISRFREHRRERWLSAEEMQRFIEALDSYHDQSAADALRLLLLTGSREQEALSADWSQFDLTRGVWTKPAHATKEKRTEHVPLSAPALELLRRMNSRNTTSPLFRGKNGPRVTIRKPFIAICRAAGLCDEYTIKGKRGRPLTRYRPTLRIHDLRHSFGSHLVSSGVSLEIVGKLLGHTQAATTKRYAHLQDEALRDATNRFGEIFKAASKEK
jgi:integrase